MSENKSDNEMFTIKYNEFVADFELNNESKSDDDILFRLILTDNKGNIFENEFNINESKNIIKVLPLMKLKHIPKLLKQGLSNDNKYSCKHTILNDELILNIIKEFDDDMIDDANFEFKLYKKSIKATDINNKLNTMMDENIKLKDQLKSLTQDIESLKDDMTKLKEFAVTKNPNIISSFNADDDTKESKIDIPNNPEPIKAKPTKTKHNNGIQSNNSFGYSGPNVVNPYMGKSSDEFRKILAEALQTLLQGNEAQLDLIIKFLGVLAKQMKLINDNFDDSRNKLMKGDDEIFRIVSYNVKGSNEFLTKLGWNKINSNGKTYFEYNLGYTKEMTNTIAKHLEEVAKGVDNIWSGGGQTQNTPKADQETILRGLSELFPNLTREVFMVLIEKFPGRQAPFYADLCFKILENEQMNQLLNAQESAQQQQGPLSQVTPSQAPVQPQIIQPNKSDKQIHDELNDIFGDNNKPTNTGNKSTDNPSNGSNGSNGSNNTNKIKDPPKTKKDDPKINHNSDESDDDDSIYG